METSGGTATRERTEVAPAIMAVTFGEDREAAMRCFDSLKASGFETLALITLDPETGGAYAVEAYSAPLDTIVPAREQWWGKRQLDDLGRIAEEGGTDLWIACRHDNGGRMVARFT